MSAWRMTRATPVPKFNDHEEGRRQVWARPVVGHHYAMGIDFARGEEVALVTHGPSRRIYCAEGDSFAHDHSDSCFIPPANNEPLPVATWWECAARWLEERLYGDPNDDE